jgi:hypothetical protein
MTLLSCVAKQTGYKCIGLATPETGSLDEETVTGSRLASHI